MVTNVRAVTFKLRSACVAVNSKEALTLPKQDFEGRYRIAPDENVSARSRPSICCMIGDDPGSVREEPDSIRNLGTDQPKDQMYCAKWALWKGGGVARPVANRLSLPFSAVANGNDG